MKSSWYHASLLLLLHNALLSHQTYLDTKFSLVYKWRFAEFDYPDDVAREVAIERGNFTPNNIAIMDVDYHASTKRYFVTTPPFRPGIPATLSQVTEGQGALKPFPSWPNKDNEEEMCRGPFAVFRIHIDRCGLMWVLDAGRGDAFNKSRIFCPPKLLVYDLEHGDTELLRYELPKNVYTDRCSLINIVTESYKNDCSDTFVYIADANDHGLIMFNYAEKKSWRIENKYFWPYPLDATVTVNGVVYEVMAGLMGLALGPLTAERERNLYFHSFNSVREGWVSVNILKNQSVANDRTVRRIGFFVSPGTRAGQSTVEVMTNDGILIYSAITMNALACWNSRTPYTLENQHILKKDDENFQFISGMKLQGNELILLSSRFQNYMVGKGNGTDFKYRIMVIEDVKSLLWNTPCSAAVESERTSYRSSSNGVFSETLFGESNGNTPSRFSSNSRSSAPFYSVPNANGYDNSGEYVSRQYTIVPNRAPNRAPPPPPFSSPNGRFSGQTFNETNSENGKWITYSFQSRWAPEGRRPFLQRE